MLLSDLKPSYSETDRRILLDVAAQSVAEGVKARRPLPIRVSDFSEPLQQPRGCFVTLRIEQRLRGCMGTLTAKRSLVEDVAYNAYSSALRDPRFAPVTAAEVEQLDVHLSVLSEAAPIDFVSIDDLIERIRPGIDGLIVRSGSRTGTLLPAVWKQLPDKYDFWTQLLKKAGLPEGYWDDDLTVLRYTAESFGRTAKGCFGAEEG